MSKPTPIVHNPNAFELPDSQRRVVLWTVLLGFAALAVGIVNGLGQALNYAHIDILKYFPGMRTYYQGLTVHGVFNAIVFTFAFANGFCQLCVARGLGRPVNGLLLNLSFATLALGSVLAAGSIVAGKASVLFTFYPPLQAHWAYYLGLALGVISTWIASANLFLTLAAWRKDNPGKRIPLLAYMPVCTYIMWDIASLGIAIEVVALLLPWSMGLVDKVDPLLSRTLFWFSGHPIVYFWLLPVYVSWYGMAPKQAGGALFSDKLTRIVFLLFIALSIPVGFHHQYSDPSIGGVQKFVHTILTFGVFFPSLATAFSLMVSLEIGGRRRGGKGLLGWIPKLPWGDPSLVSQLLAMLTFMLGGITGLMLASYNINAVVHNTAFVPGHFHMTVGTAVALSMMGIMYWLAPWLVKRELWGKGLALAQPWVYFVGVLIFARGMISGGLEGMPRRTMLLGSPYWKESWELAGILTGVGGTLMFLSGMMFYVVLGMTLFFGKNSEAVEFPFTETIEPPAASGPDLALDKFRYVIAVTVVLILIAYGPWFAQYLPGRFLSPGFKIF